MTSPLVSVLIPTYRYAQFLPTAIESVLQQTLRDIEVVIIDDASSDDTRNILERYARKDRRLRWEINAVNLGMVANWNLCLARAQGRYVKYLMADDVLLARDALEKMVAPLESRPDIALVASARQIVDGDGQAQDVWCHWPDGADIDGAEVIRRCLLTARNLIGEPTATLFRRADATRGFHPEYRQITDLEMWFHLLERGRFFYLADPLCAFRVHPEQQTARSRAHAYDVLDQQLLFRDYLCNPVYRFTAREQWFMHYRLLRLFQRRARRTGEGRALVRQLLGDYGRLRFILDYPRYRYLKHRLPRQFVYGDE